MIAWPLDSPNRRPVAANDFSYGVTNALEIFAPMSPNLALLMSWRDRKSPPLPTRGAEHHAATINAFVTTNAAEQWFHQLDGPPRIARGPRPPLTRELLPGYDAAEARASDRRALARELANAEAARPIGNDPLHAVGEARMPA